LPDGKLPGEQHHEDGGEPEDYGRTDSFYYKTSCKSGVPIVHGLPPSSAKGPGDQGFLRVKCLYIFGSTRVVVLNFGDDYLP
jgi:hypothetical protein